MRSLVKACFLAHGQPSAYCVLTLPEVQECSLGSLTRALIPSTRALPSRPITSQRSHFTFKVRFQHEVWGDTNIQSIQ